MAFETRWIWSEPGSWIAQISDERWGATAAGDEVAARVHSTAYGYLKGTRFGFGVGWPDCQISQISDIAYGY